MNDIRTCATCGNSEPDVKFSAKHRKCNRCRAQAADPEKNREAQRKSRAKYPGKNAARVRNDRANAPHKVFHVTSRYHANLAGVPSDLSVEDALDIYNSPNVCAYCGVDHGKKPAKRAVHVDHIIPMIQGGHNTRWNLTKVCNGCNSSKRSSSLIDFRSRTPEFTQERFDAVIAGMVERSGLTYETVLRLLDQSNAFERAMQRERKRLTALLADEIAGLTLIAA